MDQRTKKEKKNTGTGKAFLKFLFLILLISGSHGYL